MFPFQAQLARLGLAAGDFEESFARSGGPGGQHVNNVSTAVTLRHRPSGLAVTVQDSRSQSANRELARERLLAAIENARRGERQARIDAREKTRRQKSPRPRALKRRILEAKRHRSAVKVQRRSPGADSH
jgi:protein subunit release factor B